MSKLDSIILDYGNRMLDVANGKENPTLGELNGKPVEEIKQLFQELIDEVIGDDLETETYEHKLYETIIVNNTDTNKLRAEQRQRAKKLMEKI